MSEYDENIREAKLIIECFAGGPELVAKRTIYKNGVKIHTKNKRIALTERKEGGFVIKIVSLNNNLPEKLEPIQEVGRGKVLTTWLCLSDEALEMLLQAIILYRKSHITEYTYNKPT